MKVLVIADYDDPDVCELARAGVVHKESWMKLGLPSREYSLEISPEEASCSVSGMAFNSSSVGAYDLVLFRRWRVSPPTPAVRFDDLPDRASCNLAEREWDAAIRLLHALWYNQRGANVRWSRSPKELPGKHELMSLVQNVVKVPRWAATTHPKTRRHEAVTKTVGNDQSYGDGNRTSTIIVDEQLSGAGEMVPVLLQSHVIPKREVRLVYSFGLTAQVVQREGSTGPLDVRFAPTVARRRIADPALEEEAGIVARTLGLHHFTADILIDHAGNRWWIDINPDGLSVPCDDSDGTLLLALSQSLASCRF